MCLKCSGAERTKCTGGFSLQLVGLFTAVVLVAAH